MHSHFVARSAIPECPSNVLTCQIAMCLTQKFTVEKDLEAGDPGTRKQPTLDRQTVGDRVDRRTVSQRRRTRSE